MDLLLVISSFLIIFSASLFNWVEARPNAFPYTYPLPQQLHIDGSAPLFPNNDLHLQIGLFVEPYIRSIQYWQQVAAELRRSLEQTQIELDNMRRALMISQVNTGGITGSFQSPGILGETNARYGLSVIGLDGSGSDLSVDAERNGNDLSDLEDKESYEDEERDEDDLREDEVEESNEDEERDEDEEGDGDDLSEDEERDEDEEGDEDDLSEDEGDEEGDGDDLSEDEEGDGDDLRDEEEGDGDDLRDEEEGDGDDFREEEERDGDDLREEEIGNDLREEEIGNDLMEDERDGQMVNLSSDISNHLLSFYSNEEEGENNDEYEYLPINLKNDDGDENSGDVDEDKKEKENKFLI